MTVVGVAVVPGDEIGCGVAALKLLARNVQSCDQSALLS
jgi:hypothetical protein